MVIVIDVNGCIVIEVVMIDILFNLIVFIIIFELIVCLGENIFMVIVIVLGGMVFFIYFWSIGEIIQ